MNRVKDKVAIVTGAGSGIGAACAHALVEEGAKVVFADINLQAATQQAEATKRVSETAAIAVDIGDEAQVRRMIEFTVQRFGGLDVLHNNAADTHLSRTRDAPVEQMDVAVWDDIMRINLRGTMLGCKYAITASACARRRIHHQHRIGRSARRNAVAECLWHFEGGHRRSDEVRRHAVRQRRDSLQRDLTGFHRHARDGTEDGGSDVGAMMLRHHLTTARRSAGGHCRRRRVPRFG